MQAIRRTRFRGRRGLVAAVLCSVIIAGCSDDELPTEPSDPASLLELFGDSLYRADGTVEGLDALDDVALIGIYVAARSCPACANFTPLLVSVYDQLQTDGRSFEVVLVSTDSSEEIMFAYMEDAGMPWLAVPWGGSHAIGLLERYDVRWIPTLVIIDGDGRTVSMNGRDELVENGAAAYDGWLEAAGG
ncbi:MAG: thioredoxin-like domain-containing protein [Gemmatimonadota bacterium]